MTREELIQEIILRLGDLQDETHIAIQCLLFEAHAQIENKDFLISDFEDALKSSRIELNYRRHNRNVEPISIEDASEVLR